MGIGIREWGLELGIEIGNWDGRLGFGLVVGIGDWDWDRGLGIRIGDWNWDRVENGIYIEIYIYTCGFFYYGCWINMKI